MYLAKQNSTEAFCKANVWNWRRFWLTTNGARVSGGFHKVKLSWGWDEVSLPVTDHLHPGQRMLNPVTVNGGGTCTALECITCRTKAYKLLCSQSKRKVVPSTLMNICKAQRLAAYVPTSVIQAPRWLFNELIKVTCDMVQLREAPHHCTMWCDLQLTFVISTQFFLEEEPLHVLQSTAVVHAEMYPVHAGYVVCHVSFVYNKCNRCCFREM